MAILEVQVTADATMHNQTDYLAVANATWQAIVRMHSMGMDIHELDLSCSATEGLIVIQASNSSFHD